LKEIAKNGPKPLNGGNAGIISNVSINGNNVAFTDTKRSPVVTALYVSLGGQLYSVQSAGARGGGLKLDGKVIQSLVIGPHSLKGNSIIFRARFSDTDSAVYRADLTP
jgi:hypothetical protein